MQAHYPKSYRATMTTTFLHTYVLLYYRYTISKWNIEKKDIIPAFYFNY